MKSDLYGSAHIERCRGQGHRFKLTWSDKRPLKASILCETCSESQLKSVYVAYGEEDYKGVRSFGEWRGARRRDSEA